MRAELADITEIEDRWGYVQKTMRTGDQRQYTDEDRYRNYALVIRRRLDHKEEPKGTQLEIRSSVMRKALQTICGDNEFINTQTTPITIEALFHALFLYREQIREYAAKAEDEHEKVITVNSLHTNAKADKRINKPLEDIVPGKGKGLIFPLSSPPGLGKTLTTECIAKEMKLPLYAITSGELGTNVAVARVNSWRAILLLDEADVFLAKCKIANLERNALVSIFFRSIEYYPGIIFLTSNRSVPSSLLHDFDKAFESRIHLRIHYQPLDAKQRTSIWRHLHSSFAKWLWDSTIYEALGQKLDLNGREIKNIFQIALAVAEFQEEIPEEKHIWQVHKLSLMWQDSGEPLEVNPDE